jgi:hypothetical protein
MNRKRILESDSDEEEAQVSPQRQESDSDDEETPAKKSRKQVDDNDSGKT